MAEPPQPIESLRHQLFLVWPLALRAREFLCDPRKWGSRILGQVRQGLPPDFLGWLSIVLVVPVLIYGASELGLYGVEMPSAPVYSRLVADYGEWVFTEIRRVKPGILDEIQKDRPNEGFGVGAPVQESGFVGTHESMQEPEGGGSQSGAPISPTPSPTGVVHDPSTTSTGISTPDVTPTLKSPPTVEPTLTPMATDTATLTPSPYPTNTPVPTNPPSTETSNVIICHKRAVHQKTIIVPESDVSGHLGHGDHLGACSEG